MVSAYLPLRFLPTLRVHRGRPAFHIEPNNAEVRSTVQEPALCPSQPCHLMRCMTQGKFLNLFLPRMFPNPLPLSHLGLNVTFSARPILTTLFTTAHSSSPPSPPPLAIQGVCAKKGWIPVAPNCNFIARMVLGMLGPSLNIS